MNWEQVNFQYIVWEDYGCAGWIPRGFNKPIDVIQHIQTETANQFVVTKRLHLILGEMPNHEEEEGVFKNDPLCPL